MGIQKAREPLLKMLNSDSKKSLHYHAAYSLACLGDERAIPHLDRLAHTETDLHYRHVCRKCICRLKGISIAEYYRSILGELKPKERLEMIERFFWTSEEDSAVLKMLSKSDPLPGVRGQAILQLRKFKRDMESYAKHKEEKAETNRLLEELSKKKKE